MEIEWIKNRRPTAEDADRDGHVRLALKDLTYTLVDFESVASGATWAHTERWHDEHPEEQVLSGWINDRLPSEWDADIDGDVLVPSNDSEGDVFVSWKTIQAGQQWRHGCPAGRGLPTWSEQETPQEIKFEGWINNRLPEIHDSDIDGDVELPDPDGQGEVCVPWQYVVAGQTWRHCFGANQHHQTVEANGRTFVSVVPYPNPGDYCLLAIANDGTAWELSSFGPVWQQLPALPQYGISKDWKTGETFVPSTENIQEVACDAPVVDVPVPLCVRLPEGDDLDKDGNCLYGFWDSSQGGGRWIFSYQGEALEEDTHWIRHDAEALPETCYKPANID